MYAIFVAYSVAAHNKKVTLLRGAGTRMASFFYAMFRLLRLKDVLIQTVHSPEVGKLDLNARAKAVIRDIKTPQFFHAIYVVCSVVYPNLKLLWFCDKLTPVMDVLHHLTLRTTAALEQQREKLVEPGLFDKGRKGMSDRRPRRCLVPNPPSLWPRQVR